MLFDSADFSFEIEFEVNSNRNQKIKKVKFGVNDFLRLT